MNATEWEWVVCRVEGMGDMVAECGERRAGRAVIARREAKIHNGFRFRRRLHVEIRQPNTGTFNLHIERHPDLDLMEKIVPEIEVPAERIIFIGKANADAIHLAEQALGEGERIVKAGPGDVERAARVFRGSKGGNGG